MATQASTRLSAARWSEYQSTILDLYINKGLQLNEVRSHMERHHKFRASEMAYKKKLGRWRASKKRKQEIETKNELSNDNLLNMDTHEEDLLALPSPPSSPSRDPFKVDYCASTFANDYSSQLLFTGQQAADTGSTGNEFFATNLQDLMANHEYKWHGINTDPLLRQFFQSTVGGAQNTHPRLIKWTLDGLFDRYAAQHDLASLERIIAAYLFVFGPQDGTYHEKFKRFLEISAVPTDRDLQMLRKFKTSIKERLQAGGSPSDHSQLRQDVSQSLQFWYKSYLSDDELVSVMETLNQIYTANWSLLSSRYEPWLILFEKCLEDNQTERLLRQGTLNSDVLIFAIRKILLAIRDALEVAILDSDWPFVVRFMDSLWRWQQEPKQSTICKEYLLIALIELEALFKPDTGPSWHYCSAICCCIIISCHMMLLSDSTDLLAVNTWIRRLGHLAGFHDSDSPHVKEMRTFLQKVSEKTRDNGDTWSAERNTMALDAGESKDT